MEGELTEDEASALVPMPDVSIRSFEHNLFERWADRALRLASMAGLSFTDLRPESILRAARRGTRLSDFGDERFREPMRRSLQVVADGPYTSLGRAFIRGVVVRLARHRLHIEQWFKDHPETSQISIQRPIFVLGFPRSGTTLLQNLLEQAPNRRALRFWELTNPVPEHDEPSRDRASRLRRARRDLTWAYRFVPEMEEMHEVRADTVEECWPLLANTYAVLNFDICHGLRPYGDWLMKQDMGWAYREYRRQLQLLLWRERVDQLVLKCPEHLWFLDSLLETFPDACIVWTHRDPLDSVASYSSLISLSRRTLQGRIDPHKIGPHIADRFQEGVSRAMAARLAHGEESRFFDVHFDDLVHDPVGVTNRVEEHFGLDPTDSRLLDDWLSKKRGDAPGRHRYVPEMWNLDHESIREQFAEYIAHFNVAATDETARMPGAS